MDRHNRRQPPEQPVEHGGASPQAQSQWIIHQLNEHSYHLNDHTKSLGKIEALLDSSSSDLNEMKQLQKKHNTTILISTGVLIGAAAAIGFMMNSITKLSAMVEALSKASGG